MLNELSISAQLFSVGLEFFLSCLEGIEGNKTNYLCRLSICISSFVPCILEEFIVYIFRIPMFCSL